jgi:hypothetical protein
MSLRRKKGRGSIEIDISCAEREIKEAEEVIRWGTRNLNEAKAKLATAQEMQRRREQVRVIMDAPYAMSKGASA